MIRAVRPTDVVALAAFQGQTPVTQITACTWPRVSPEHARLSLLRLLSQSLLYPAARRGAWLSMSRGRVEGAVIGTARAGGLVWDVEQLVVGESNWSAAESLLDHLAGRAALSGARRVFFTAPVGSRGMEVARRAGFERYVSSTLVVLTPPFRADCSRRIEARPRLRADELPLFQLYNAAVPLRVRSAEAMTCDEWAALHRGRRRWSPSLLSSQEQVVWEQDGVVVGWLKLTFRRQSQHLALLVHPKYDDVSDKLLNFGISQASERAPLYASVRDYQHSLSSALERAGFQTVGISDCFVRHLASRVTEPRLVPANIVGGC